MLDRPAPQPSEDAKSGTPDAELLGIPQSLRSSLLPDLEERAQLLKTVKLRQAAEQQREAKQAKMLPRPVPRPRPQKAKYTPRVIRQAPRERQCVEMRVAGFTNDEIAEQLGMAEASVRQFVRKWVIKQAPREEEVAELRRLMTERLERLHETHWAKALGEADPETGEWIVEPDLKAGEFCLNLMDREAKLHGVDMQPSQTTLLISAESIAAYLGWDQQGEVHTAVIDVEATPPRLELEEGESGES